MEKRTNTLYGKHWIREIELEVEEIIKEERYPNKEYTDKYVTVMNGLKRLLNSIIKTEAYNYISLWTLSTVLQRLAKGYPLSAIKDIPEEWSDIVDVTPQTNTYQSKRYPSLFKIVDIITGHVSYRDVNKFGCIYAGDQRVRYHSGMIDKILAPLYPITMPYYPEDEQILVMTDDFLFDPRNGDFDTIAILYAMHPFSGKKKIHQFYKEVRNKNYSWLRISHFEYLLRKMVKVDPNSKWARAIRRKSNSFLYKKMNIPNTGEGSISCVPPTEGEKDASDNS